jgi:hypothetical protein
MKDPSLEITGGLKMLECMIVSVANKNYSFQIINMKVKVDIQLFGIILLMLLISKMIY